MSTDAPRLIKPGAAAAAPWTGAGRRSGRDRANGSRRWPPSVRAARQGARPVPARAPRGRGAAARHRRARRSRTRPTATRSRSSSRAPYPGRPGARGAHHRRSCAGTRWRWWCAPTRRYGELGGHIAQLRVGGRDLRGRLQPLLPRPRRRPRRRSGVLPAAFGARRLCARLPRRAADRGRSSRNYRQEVGGARPVAPIRIRG